jgi:hypothetical protein
MGRREAWWTNFLMMALGIIVFVATIAILWAGLATYTPP